MSELRWLDGGQPSVPDPTRDRHVAFPDDAVAGPQSSDDPWSTRTAGAAPDDPNRDLAIHVVGTGRDGQPVSARISMAPGVQWGWRVGEAPGTPGGRRPMQRRRKGRVGAALLALALVALVVRPGGSAESSSGGTSSGVCFGDCQDLGAGAGSGRDPAVGVAPAALQVAPLSAGEAEGLVETRQRGPVGTMPEGSSSVLVEIVSTNGSSARVTIANEGGGFDAVVSLPFAARVAVPDGTVPFRVTAVGDVEQATIQCRVYAGSTQVATARDVHTVDCTPEPARP
ncbi:hypothetical protein N865_01955 [Intrasporangium oryzae NRRL B-24470]|uniref:Uncharacterized protein n=1 Tax=Intrasporangium oryzae NRRL B-24470 TaxID=1386089 RepID=W9GDC8_9MICO|nr:hypothetical protein [Intrasporangium oryzae]EWT03227.1 hypothetical protein N865_01955 [Intrasporangium oryzae NRRL B-24470]